MAMMMMMMIIILATAFGFTCQQQQQQQPIPLATTATPAEGTAGADRGRKDTPHSFASQQDSHLGETNSGIMNMCIQISTRAQPH